MAENEADVVADLTKWYKERYSEKVEDGLRTAYLFSPEWEQRMHPWWAKYDKLEKQREALGVPPLSWQEKEEGFRSSTSAVRALAFKPMQDRLWPLCPLSAHLAKFLDRPDHQDDRRLYGWASLLDDWQNFRSLMRENPRLRPSLSPTQQRSYDLLCSWWMSAYCDKELLEHTVAYLESRRPFKTIADPSSASNLLRMSEKVKTNTSMYHADMFRLFLLEFHPQSWEPYISHNKLHPLQFQRYESSCLATIQKLAYATLHPRGAEPHGQEPYPKVVQNDAAHQAMTLATLVSPYHLWDSEIQETVDVKKLPTCPPYVCISHTWGRWRKETAKTVPGVPWKVPENTLYDVGDLPNQLNILGYRYIWLDLFCIPQGKLGKELDDRAQAEIGKQASIFKGSSHCIAWINDVNSWDSVLNGLYWISLRAMIIMSASNTEVIKEMIKEAAIAANVPMELVKRIPYVGVPEADDPFDSTFGQPVGWFSSLWTLQECVLCPEIELYTRTWERLEDKQGTPISLRSLMVFLRDTEKRCWPEEPIDTPFADRDRYATAMENHPERSQKDAKQRKFPNAVRDLYYLCMITRLDNVLTIGSPTTVLTNANLRQCSDLRSRGPAIMSAVGVTDWYKNSPDPEREPKVFGMYPLALLREAAAKFGALFYDTTSSSLSRRRTAGELQLITHRAERQGTMLPVAKKHGWFCPIAGSYEHTYLDRQDHEAVSTWTINLDGSVTMHSVGIEMTSGDKTCERKVEAIVGYASREDHEAGKGDYHVEKVPDMLSALKSLSLADGSRSIYAVALHHDFSHLHGVLLERVRLSVPGIGKTYLTKIGNFIIQGASLPASKNVNWKVL